MNETRQHPFEMQSQPPLTAKYSGKPYEKPAPSMESKSLPRITISQSVRDASSYSKNSIWKHGAALKQKFNQFEVDQDLVQKHMPQMQECND